MLKHYLKLVLILFLAMNISGCAELRKKFIRKKKPREEERAFYRAEEYRPRPARERYYDHYVFWRNWQLDLERMEGTTRDKRDVYVGTRPVTFEEYAAVMNASPAHAEGPQKPVTSANHGEAREYCRRYADYLRAAHPFLFNNDLKSYVCRLPTLREAARRSLAVPKNSASTVTAEWLQDDRSRDVLEPTSRLIPPMPVRVLDDPTNAEASYRRRPEQRVTFRIVLAPGGE